MGVTLDQANRLCKLPGDCPERVEGCQPATIVAGSPGMTILMNNCAQKGGFAHQMQKFDVSP